MGEVFRKKANARLHRRGWVGGEIVLTDTFLAFEANILNKIIYFYRGELSAKIGLEKIVGARISGGIGTKIVQVDLAGNDDFLFRCTDAEEVLASLVDSLPASN